MEFVKGLLQKQPQKVCNDIIALQQQHRCYHIHYGGNKSSIPNVPLKKWSTDIVSACTGPNAGITQLDLQSVTMKNDCKIGGVSQWDTKNENLYGTSASLYEDNCHSQVGDPIADVYASVVRGNNTVAAIADGCGWGKKPRLAARCAVRAAVEYISNNITKFNKHPSSETLLGILKEAMDASQDCILAHKATLTTLSIAVTCQTTAGTWAVFTVSLGDSRVFVYSQRHHTLMELTIGSHPSNGVRCLNNCGGSLGPAIGTLPDWEGLSFSFTPICKGDVVTLMTDGISDNFELSKIPNDLIGRIRTRTIEDDFSLISMTDTLLPTPHTNGHDHDTTLASCCQSSYELHRVVREHCGGNTTAKTLSKFLLEWATKVTEEKRNFRSECAKNEIDIRAREREDPEFAKLRKKQVGKLDHATVLCYTV